MMQTISSRKKDSRGTFPNFLILGFWVWVSGEYTYVIHWPGGPYWEVSSTARQRAQFFPIQTDHGW